MGKVQKATAQAVAALGMAYEQMASTILCDVCFRHAASGCSRCHIHVRVASHSPADHPVRARCRRAQRVRELHAIDWEMPVKPAHCAERLEMAVHLAWMQLLTKDAEHARPEFPLHARQLQRALVRCPRVREVAAGLAVLNYRQRVESLRSAFDPDDEMNATYWPLKVYEVEQWLDTEASIVLHRAHRANSPRSKVKDAVIALRSGTSCKDVAESLRVAQSTISKWKKRYPEAFKAAPTEDW
jgi:hypothetical protein